jgi:hypothetical protein
MHFSQSFESEGGNRSDLRDDPPQQPSVSSVISIGDGWKISSNVTSHSFSHNSTQRFPTKATIDWMEIDESAAHSLNVLLSIRHRWIAERAEQSEHAASPISVNREQAQI